MTSRGARVRAMMKRWISEPARNQKHLGNAPWCSQTCLTVIHTERVSDDDVRGTALKLNAATTGLRALALSRHGISPAVDGVEQFFAYYRPDQRLAQRRTISVSASPFWRRSIVSCTTYFVQSFALSAGSQPSFGSDCPNKAPPPTRSADLI